MATRRLLPLYEGDCEQVLKTLPSNTFDAVVTDPPYGINFMGLSWDHGVPSEAVWRHVLRVMKPGAHLIAFAGTRTYHRMAVAVEDAGFEIRDMVSWMYGTGFPKSTNIGKAIDKAGGADAASLEKMKELAAEIKEKRAIEGFSMAGLAAHFPQHRAITRNWERTDYGQRVPNEEDYNKLVELIGLSPEWRPLVRAMDLRAVTRTDKTKRKGDGTVIGLAHDGTEREATTEKGRELAGIGTALKPACEPCVLARKPLSEHTAAANVLKWGTGALDIDSTRIELNGDYKAKANGRPSLTKKGDGYDPANANQPDTVGRWPANVIHDGSDEVVTAFPPKVARFFYCAKAGPKDRRNSKHTTVKPIALMRYLCKLIVPKGGTVLDPFAGSGTTAEAAILEGFKPTLIEKEAESIQDIKDRYAALGRTTR